MIKAIVMAGGLGSRLKVNVEKPLFIFYKKPLIDYVIDNLIKSSCIEEIFVAVSPNTPNTKKYISKFKNIKTIDTPGEGYLNDLSFILNSFEKESKNDILTFINSDLPFISYKCIDHVLKEYFKFNKDSLSVYIPSDFLDDLSLNYEYEYKGLVPSGLNILRSQNIVQEEHKLIIPLIDLAININTLDDVGIANNF
ncbi:NTP transferase domain-containing protein, partial [Methanobrevibacter sp. OttesenSCG-928-K11]|nr:NTP transferase domain-containing protein [Methanobrevibacter sp. OttesenSCG-928-K11]